jgi:ribosome-associated toxin RatA of RatAB toxin-antitoxin module
MEHEHSARIPVPPDRLYKTISEIGNLTKFVPPLTSVRRKDSGHVDVDASYEGHEQHGEAWFRTDDDARKIEWGSEGHPYRGWLQVEPDGEASKLTLHLTTTDVGDIQRYVQSTFDSVRKMF